MELKERIEALRERGRLFTNASALTAAIARDYSFKSEIQSVYRTIFGRTVSGCGNCVADAFFEIIHAENIMEKAKLEYRLRAGALLQDVVNLDSSKSMSNKNVSEELALHHLSTNPDCRKYFELLPEDVDARVEKFKGSAIEKQPETTSESLQNEDNTEETTVLKSSKKPAKKATKQ